MIVPISVSVDFGDAFDNFIETLSSCTVSVQPPGVVLFQLLNTISGGLPLSIIETGCLRDTKPGACFSDGWSTYYFARWVKDHPLSTCISIDLNSENIFTCQKFLQEKNLAEYVVFKNAEA